MKRRNVIFLAVLLLIAAPIATDAAPTVDHIRYSLRDGQTRIVIDLSAHAPYEIISVKSPERIAINIPRTNAGRSLKAMAIPEGVVRQIRINRLSWGSQVVLDLRSQASWSDFFLVSVDDMPHRIVLDVGTGKKEKVTREASSPPRMRPERRPYVIAIDAGHGGSDPGTMGNRLVEKRDALEISKRLAKEINSRSGYKAVLTRDRDEFLSLPSRTRIAKKKGADIFVSVHLNSAPKKSARGVEVFFLSPRGAESIASRFLANKDRAAAELGLEGARNEDILQMLVDVNQQSMMQRSSLLAEEILKAMKRSGLPPSRSIKQRSFAVLKSIDMPSVMVETGFVTNSKDAKILRSDKGKTATAKAIADGVLAFMKKYPPPEESGRVVVYRVKKGDTLWRISRKYNTSVASIQRSNRMGGSKTITIGQELVIREGYETY